MVTATAKTQDLPPPGGYNPIQTDRIPLRSIFGFRNIVATFVVTNIIGFTSYYYDLKKYRRSTIEMRSGQLAIWPILHAERDRTILKKMRQNREMEADLMKNVPGWEVGKLDGLPTYLSRPEDEWVEPILHDYFAHCKPSELRPYLSRNNWL